MGCCISKEKPNSKNNKSQTNNQVPIPVQIKEDSGLPVKNSDPFILKEGNKIEMAGPEKEDFNGSGLQKSNKLYLSQAYTVASPSQFNTKLEYQLSTKNQIATPLGQLESNQNQIEINSQKKEINKDFLKQKTL